MKTPPLPPPKERPHGADITREQLLQATHELLYERGGAPGSVADICERAGVNNAMVRYCFGNKGGLLLALTERITDSFRADFDQLDATPLDWRTKLRRHVHGIARNYLRYPYINRLLMDQLRGAQGLAPQRLADSFAAPLATFHRGLLDEAASASKIRPVDPDFFFFSLFGMCEFIFSAEPWLQSAFDRELDDRLVDEYAEHVFTLLLSGIESA